ncbi:manganese-dependent inorganic pyrophosphatase [Candidatus Shapirobacteria bacterium]|nr:MAG: manganese-dependent inorganic pyrophosphatase [Candidatus Shapirobacteria bacterium]
MKYIIGHKKPDTDSVCSAIAYARFLRKQGQQVQAISLGKLNNETSFVLKKFKTKTPKIISILPKKSKVILIDHNQKIQSIDNLEELDVLEIIDHHSVNIKSSKTISLCVKPLGSSCSIVAQKYFYNNIGLNKNTARLLLAGIISDTLFFRSPTTTQIDKDLVFKLNKIAQIKNLKGFSLDMFEAKSSLGDISAEDLIKLDYKIFDFNGNRCGISVMETTNVSNGLNKKKEISAKLTTIKKRDNLKTIYFTIIDILNKKSYTLYSDDRAKRLFIELFRAKEDKGVLFVDKLISRKKQIVPIFNRKFS